MKEGSSNNVFFSANDFPPFGSISIDSIPENHTAVLSTSFVHVRGLLRLILIFATCNCIHGEFTLSL